MVFQHIETRVFVPLKEVQGVWCYVQHRVHSVQLDTRPAISYRARIASVDGVRIYVPADILVTIEKKELSA